MEIGGTAVASGGGKIDPSKLHLKKELTQIRKAARALKDPGTTSTWRSPLNSARSLNTHHYPRRGEIDGNAAANSSSPEQSLKVHVKMNHDINYSNYNSSNAAAVVDKKNMNMNMKEKENRVFLYNWRSQKFQSERLKRRGDDESDESDTGLSEEILKFRDTNFTPSIRRTIKKKLKRGNYRMQKQMPSRSLGLAERSDDSNSEDLRRETALSPFLARLKKNGLANSSPKLLRSSLRKEDDSISHSTPALSVSSYNKYGGKNPSVAGSWDVATGSYNDADDEVDDGLDLPGRQGCGISCCWSRRSTPKSRGGYGSCCSPSLSETLRWKGNILCGRHRRGHSLGSNKRRLSSRTGSQYRVPLLTNGRRGSSLGSGNSEEDELSANFGELDLEGLSRLDGRRWSSSCRSQEVQSSPENSRSLSHKYRPMFFDELIGQNIVVQSLTTAVLKGRIAPICLFQGPRGTGKTSTARIFASALNCLTSDENKPCGVCRECSDFISGKSQYLVEINGSNKKGVNGVKNLLKRVNSSGFMVFVVDECHLLPSKTWLTFLRLLEKPLPHVVFILVTTDTDNVPRTILSRCQKHIFNKISNTDIVARLSKIVADEKFDVDSDVLDLIASNSDGSLRDAETMLDQLSLFGKRITVSLVNELIGVVSDEKLLDLLELAMSSNATETVIRARELLDSGVDPIVLMSQLATLIVDIIAGTYSNVDEKHDSFLGGRSLSERELNRLKHALTLLSDAEKHLRVSNERSTWFTATLLQLGSMPSPDQSHSGSSRRPSSKATEEDRATKQRIDTQLINEELGSRKSFSRSSQRNSMSNQSQFNGGDKALSVSQDDDKGGRTSLRRLNSKMLTDIWIRLIEKCHSKTLRQLLHSNGRLVSISETKGSFVAHVAFSDKMIKTRAEGFLSSITNAFEIVLRQNVEVKIILLPDSLCLNLTDDNLQTASGNGDTSHLKEGKLGVPGKRIDSIIQEQRLETAWLQTMEKPERNQVLPQDSTCPNESELLEGDELNNKINDPKYANGTDPQEDQLGKGVDRCPISPSLLHNTNCNRDSMGYESGTGPPGCLCWNNTKTSRRAQAKQRTHLRARKNGRFSWLCGKPRQRDNIGYTR